MPDVRIDVYADTHGTPAKLDETKKALEGVEKGSGVASGTMGGLWKQFAIGQLAVAGLQKAYGALKDFVGDSIKGAIDEEQAKNSLRAALEITGRTVEGNIQHYLDFANAQMKVTTYDDEQIKSTQALLLQLTNLNQNGIDRATKGAMGLATVMGIDLHSATTMVTKAMEGNYVALSRVGIRVAENLTAEQKQASLLDQLDKLYQRSTKETDTFGGSLKQLTNSWDEVKETVGGAVVKNEAVRDAIKDVKAWVDKLATSPDFQLWLNTVMEGLVAVAREAGKFAKACWDIENRIFGATKANKEYEAAQVKLNAALDRARAAGHDVDQVTRAIAAAHAAATPKINETGTAVKGLTAEQIKAAAEAKKLKDELAKTAQAILDKYNPLQAAMRKVIKEEQDLTKAFKAGAIGEAEYRIGMAAAEKELRSFGSTLVTQVLPPARQLPGVLYNAVVAAAALAKAPVPVTKSWVQNLAIVLEKNKTTWEGITQCANAAISGMDAIMQQSTNNRMLNLDKEYQARLLAIQNSTKSEEEKNKLIEALDAEYSIKRRGVQRAAAEQGKAISIAEATMNTASGVTGALTMKPWTPFNWILATITGALGLIQIGIIKAQPIPLAAGAIFKKPAILSSAGGNTYEVAEAGEAEIVSSPRRLREAIMGKGAWPGSNRPIIIQNHIYIDGREMKSFISRTIEEAGQLGRLRVAGKAVS